MAQCQEKRNCSQKPVPVRIKWQMTVNNLGCGQFKDS